MEDKALMKAEIEDFQAIKLSIASPDEIKGWSYGEITKPETINYRTQKPERDGLFDERIFGPTKDWECYCGKYKKIRYKGIVCDRCGVEVTRSIVRRQRMGHISLCVPVAHIWYLRGTPSRIGLFLDMSIKDLERVCYFANFVITKVDAEAKKKAETRLKEEFEVLKKELGEKYTKSKKEGEGAKEALAAQTKELEEAELEFREARDNLAEMKVGMMLSESKYRDFQDKFEEVFEAKIGAEAVYELLLAIDLEKLSKELKEEIARATGPKKKKAMKRLRIVDSFKKSGRRPEWTILKELPVIPPDLRPMVQLDGGRFATSDLNDLYRRVINRNNRLKRLLDMGAPEVICRNEKRMLQEAVDALIDNEARRGKVVTTQARRKLKSLSDILRGKQGRFRQNLLGKRVDYSGRSVIVVGPELELHQCGLPKRMALELFKPFVIGRLVRDGFAPNIKSASKMIERGKSEVWDLLEEVIKEYYVLLNRAPTLHRLGIQAFQPVLVEGNAIRIHPLVCTAFNADFDGDQMAVHVPLSAMAQKEAREIMLSSKNILKPADGVPIVAPSQDMILGAYYMTKSKDGELGEGKAFTSGQEAILAYDCGKISLKAKIRVRIGKEISETTVGRIIFNSIIPEGIAFINNKVNKSILKKTVAECYQKFGDEVTAKFVNDIKNLGFEYATKSGSTISVFDLTISKAKTGIIKEAEVKTEELRNQYKMGLITDSERKAKLIETWMEAMEKVSSVTMAELDPHSSIFNMIDSGARGDAGQLNQLAGMKGLVVNPAGEIIELPIKANYREGISVLEYFISTHGARKGKSDTALRTSDSGYLTRRLVDVAQDVIVIEEDCKDKQGFLITRQESQVEGFGERIKGRFLAKAVLDEKGKEVAKAGTLITEEVASEIAEESSEVTIRSILTCKTKWGVCQTCYGENLARGGVVHLGEAVGIIAAQSIGEPGTQLTMRTFHTGGVAGVDIVQGLPRVDELFESRTPKGEAIITEIAGKVKIEEKEDEVLVSIISGEPMFDKYKLAKKAKIVVKSNEHVEKGAVLAEDGEKKVFAREEGIVEILGGELQVRREGTKEKEYKIPVFANVLVKEGDLVGPGDQLSEGSVNLAELLRVAGYEAVQKYIISEVKDIYASQGQTIADKHLEIIIRQMFSKIRIKDSNDSKFLPGEVVDKHVFDDMLDKLRSAGKNVPLGDALLLGITKVSLLTPSFLSAASFQETTRVLTEAAVFNAVDELRGLKENVIIGRLIPAGTGFRKRGHIAAEDEEHIWGQGGIAVMENSIPAEIPVQEEIVQKPEKASNSAKATLDKSLDKKDKKTKSKAKKG